MATSALTETPTVSDFNLNENNIARLLFLKCKNSSFSQFHTLILVSCVLIIRLRVLNWNLLSDIRCSISSVIIYMYWLCSIHRNNLRKLLPGSIGYNLMPIMRHMGLAIYSNRLHYGNHCRCSRRQFRRGSSPKPYDETKIETISGQKAAETKGLTTTISFPPILALSPPQ